MASRLQEIDRLGALRGQEIAAWKNLWRHELAAANSLIGLKSFSFTARLDFLEKTFSPGIRVLQLTLVQRRRRPGRHEHQLAVAAGAVRPV